jgi:acetylornithine aminotransferase/acetylornithine/N-succinyldiaminopimelate aminotransferase
LLPHVAKTGNYFFSQLKQLQSKHPSIKDVRGMGLMLAVELDSSETAKSVVSQLLAKGILINRTHDTVLRFLPPYIIEKKHVDEVVRALDKALAKPTTTKDTKVHEAKAKKSERSH